MKDFETSEHALAYLMGVYLSDGYLGGEGDFVLRVTDEIFRDEAARALDLTGSKYTLKTYPPRVLSDGCNRKQQFHLRERSPYKVGDWLWGEFEGKKDHLPNVPEDLVRDLVAGILDGDGSIRRQGRWPELVVCGYSNYLADLQKLFERFGVIMHYRPGKNGHNLNFKSFVRAGFYFRMPRKQELVEEYTSRYMKGEK